MSCVPAPIDATQTEAWAALKAHYDALQRDGISLKDWFAADPERVEKLTFDVNDLRFDLSKNLMTDETVKLLCDLARATNVEERRDQMYAGVHINTGGTGTPGIDLDKLGLNLKEEDSKKLSESIQKLNGAAEQIGKMAELTEATQKYLEQLSTMSDNMARFSTFTG